jgi:cysteinyl-tRNA synthetase
MSDPREPPPHRTEPPVEIVELARSRDRHRRAGDYARADELRDRIAAAGWTVVDTPDGFRLEPLVARPRPRLRAEQIPSLLDARPSFDVSVHWLVEGWAQDVRRGIESFRRIEGGRRVQHVVVDVTGELGGPGGADLPDGTELLELEDGTGWAQARNAGLRRSRGSLVIVVDGSVEATGDVIGPIAATLRDPSIGICGPFGIVTDDLRSFREPGPGAGADVDAIEAYLIAMPRSMLTDAGLFDERFLFYRSCDIEYSFRVKDTGRRVVVVDLPVRRHEHRMWSDTPADRRDRLSKRNFDRFLERFRGRFDLTVAGSSGAG